MSHGPRLALIGSLSLGELMVIAAVALMVFGGRLPEVAMRAAAQVLRARKAVTRMWREAGLEQELRRVQWEIERKMPRETDFELRTPSGTQRLVPPARSAPRSEPAGGEDEVPDTDPVGADGSDPDAGRLDPAVGFGAPPGTVAVDADPAPSGAPDPPPPAPDLPPRAGGGPAATEDDARERA